MYQKTVNVPQLTVNTRFFNMVITANSERSFLNKLAWLGVIVYVPKFVEIDEPCFEGLEVAKFEDYMVKTERSNLEKLHGAVTSLKEFVEIAGSEPEYIEPKIKRIEKRLDAFKNEFEGE